MNVSIDGEMVERRLNGLKKISDVGGAHNEYPMIYRHFIDTLEFLGMKVSLDADGRHSVSLVSEDFVGKV